MCYEKQVDMGGNWNYAWRTGVDEYGEIVHSSLYRHLWINGPKETSLEYQDYTHDEHWGRPVPSFLPGEAIRDYFKGKRLPLTLSQCSECNFYSYPGRWDKYQLDNGNVHYNTLVRSVKFDEQEDKIKVVVK